MFMKFTVTWGSVRNWLYGGRAWLGLGPRPLEGQADDVVVFGEADPLVGSNTLITQIFITILALGGGFRPFIAGATHAHGTVPLSLVVVVVADYDIQDVVDEEVGGQAVYAGLCQGYLLLTRGAAQLTRPVPSHLLLQTPAAESVQTWQHLGVVETVQAQGT
jgi:hypothetical protein